MSLPYSTSPTGTRVDGNFDYLRIYSIQRTSLDAEPLCKRIQDIAISGLTEIPDVGLQASYTDTGTGGDTVDPTELLYKGGETISALTMEQKDNTLFLGNISIDRPQLDASFKESLQEGVKVAQDTRKIRATAVSSGSYVYASQLTALSENGNSTVPCGGFKYGDTYRLGVQFQYRTGQWSEPVWVRDEKVSKRPYLNYDNTVIALPTLRGTIGNSDALFLLSKGYKRVRALVVFPKMQDRNVICQGVVNPTMYTTSQRVTDKNLYAQSSWFFRPSSGGGVASDCSCSPASAKGYLPYTNMNVEAGVPISGTERYDPSGSGNNIRLVEVQGQYNANNRFQIDQACVTMHSPDIEFDSQLSLTDYSDTTFRHVGNAVFSGTMSDIDIQTETPTVSNSGGGFVHKSFTEQRAYGIVSGLFYDDFVVDERDTDAGMAFEGYTKQKSSCKWMVYPWNRSGSLNNDINRPADKGTPTAVLRKKVISNLRYSNTVFDDSLWSGDGNGYMYHPQIFSSNEVSIIKLDSSIYKGNVDTSLIPDKADGDYMAFEGHEIKNVANAETGFTSGSWWKTFSKDPNDQDRSGLYHRFGNGMWSLVDENIGDDYIDLVVKKNPVRMKYKSTPHLVFAHYNKINWDSASYSLPVVEILSGENPSRFGGQTPDAFKENVWIPCGEPKLLSDFNEYGGVDFGWDYGDTYFQRWDCLKTYAFTPEDPNQVVEIGSFMLETRVNLDGRYDRNRGQMDNLSMSPTNFNLLNPVYSQTDNFFSYRILDDSYYRNTRFPNQVTWTKTKQDSADTDLWTNITLANVLDMDGSMGEVRSLNRFNDQLICFQDSGIAQIQYNNNVMVSSTDGTPIEIANSGKVMGRSYLSNTVGCSNKWSIVSGASGLYFMDSDAKNICLFAGQLSSVSLNGGFGAWGKMHIPSGSVRWTPLFPMTEEKSAFVSYYDRINQDIYFINNDYCLAYSERFGVFTSFYDYNNTPFFCNLDDTGIWIRSNTLWKHQSGEYCRFFGAPRPYSMILVGNPEPQLDKIFTNLEFRASVDGDGILSGNSFTPHLPFDSLDTWNEYQHGMAYLSHRNGHSAMMHHTRDNEASLKMRFRIWRCDIPRDNGDNLDTFDETFDDTFHPLARLQKHPLDRMRNTWLYLRLRKDLSESSHRTEIHDISMTYFG